MRGNRHIALLLLALVAVFAPLSNSELPDQTWLGGRWDGGDNDDVMLQLESTGSTVETCAPCRAHPVLIVLGSSIPPREAAVVSWTASANQTRAPPAR